MGPFGGLLERFARDEEKFFFPFFFLFSKKQRKRGFSLFHWFCLFDFFSKGQFCLGEICFFCPFFLVCLTFLFGGKKSPVSAD